MNYRLSNFIGKGSQFIFLMLGYSKDWLNLPVEDWKSNEGYKETDSFIMSLCLCE